MRDIACVAGWLYIITMTFVVLFFGGSLLLRGVWWFFLWPAVVMAAPYWSYQPHVVVPAHDPYFWASVVLSVVWMTLGIWTVADYFRAESEIER
jgi:hypothetical protein